MHTMADANTLVLMFGGFPLLGALTLLLRQNTTINWEAYFLAALVVVFSGGLLGMLVHMYLKLRHEPAYPYGLAPTHNELTLAVVLGIVLIGCAVISVVRALRLYRWRRSLYFPLRIR